MDFFAKPSLLSIVRVILLDTESPIWSPRYDSEDTSLTGSPKSEGGFSMKEVFNSSLAFFSPRKIMEVFDRL